MAKRNGPQSICYLKNRCPFCGDYGGLGFYRCSGGHIIVMCNECTTLFASPERIGPDDGITEPPSPDFWLPHFGCQLYGKDSGWATRAEIEAAGWAQWIDREYGANEQAK